MDSEDELPELVAVESVSDTEELPALEPVNDTEMPPLIPVDPSTSDRPPAELDEEDSDDMPPLMSVSESSDDDDRILSVDFTDEEESDWEDEDEVEFNNGMPPLEPFPAVRSHFTTAMEGQGDDDIPPLIPVTPSSNPQQPPAQDPSWLPPRRHTRARSAHAALPDFFDMRSVLEVLHLGPAPSGHLSPEVFTHMFNDFAGQPGPRQAEPDLERAKVLVKGLDVVPEGLLARMTRVGGAPGAHEDLSGEDESTAGCAVCWAPLVEDKIVEPEPSDDQPLPFASESGEESNIVCLPCAHVFHSSCLLPWFSRKTTCPICRFDIDPRSLTWRPQRQRQANGTANHDANVNQMSTGDWEDQTDVDDGDALGDILLGEHAGGEPLNGAIGGGDFDGDPFIFAGGGIDGSGSLGGVPLNNVLTGTPLGGGDLDGDMFRFHIPGADYSAVFGANFFGDRFQRSPTDGGRPRARRNWTLPDAPGKSLRERIVEKERDMGLRCLDATCVLGPTDEEPCPVVPGTGRQISIAVAEESKCKHTLHPACLVMSTGVAGWKPVGSSETDAEDFSAAEVSCPSCRAVGTVSREDWEEGVKALKIDW